MLCSGQLCNPDYKVKIYTGDRRGGGKCKNVKIVLLDLHGDSSTEFTLQSMCRGDFSKAKVDTFGLKLAEGAQKLDDINKIIFWRDSHDYGASWYVERISVIHVKQKAEFIFPVFRWIKPMFKYNIVIYDSTLPQVETSRHEREELLEDKRTQYILAPRSEGMPVQVKDLPDDEKFSWHNKWDIFVRASKLKIENKLNDLLSPKWASFHELKNVYNKQLPEPKGAAAWREDATFARQRTQGCNIGLIRRCKEIPEKMPVTDEMMRMFIDRWTLQEAIEQKRLYIVDLAILEGVPTRDDCHVCAPIALFFVDREKKLLPIAIQLEQTPGPDNPIFLPTDSEYTWLMAKMWFNNADAMYHQACAHLGLTHMLMEGIWASANRQLSGSHPIYKLLAPHFLYLIAINSVGLNFLLSDRGWIDQSLSIGVKGVLELIKRATKGWRIDVDGNITNNMTQRGVLDADNLKEFHFRDDAIMVHNVTKRFVTNIVHLYYDSTLTLATDNEIQNWAKELAADVDVGGVGLQGVPGNGQFDTKEDLIWFLTSVIDICTIVHAAVHVPQYDSYGFPPFYPLILTGKPPKSKEALTESDLLNAIPDKATTLRIVTVTKVLSTRDTNSIGNYENDYLYDPSAKAFLKEYRLELADVGRMIEKKNKERELPYDVLNPKNIPNSITV